MTPNTSYNYNQYLYPTIFNASTGTTYCDQSGGHLHHEDASLTVGGAYNGDPIFLEPFIIGSNDSSALPVPLNAADAYCYDILFEEASQSSTVSVGYSAMFYPTSAFSGCSLNEWCWDNQKSYGTGLSFSQSGEYATYFDPPYTLSLIHI